MSDTPTPILQRINELQASLDAANRRAEHWKQAHTDELRKSRTWRKLYDDMFTRIGGKLDNLTHIIEKEIS